jgi:hypothetical protein
VRLLFLTLIALLFPVLTFALETSSAEVKQICDLVSQRLTGTHTIQDALKSCHGMIGPEAVDFFSKKAKGIDQTQYSFRRQKDCTFLVEVKKNVIPFEIMADVDSGIGFGVNQRKIVYSRGEDALEDLWNRIEKALPETGRSSMVSNLFPWALAKDKSSVDLWVNITAFAAAAAAEAWDCNRLAKELKKCENGQLTNDEYRKFNARWVRSSMCHAREIAFIECASAHGFTNSPGSKKPGIKLPQ